MRLNIPCFLRPKGAGRVVCQPYCKRIYQRAMIPIALVFSYSLNYCRSILRGIRAYAKSRPDWVLLPTSHDIPAVRTLRQRKPVGMIAHIYEDDVARELFRLQKPIVNVCGIMPWLKAPRVGLDDFEVGRMAALHLADRGLEHFAFVGHARQGASVERLRGFRATLADYPVSVQHWPREGFNPQGWSASSTTGLLKWLARLPKPVGIFVPGDVWGLQISEFCRQLKLKIPEEVALIGVDNDDLYCEMSRPSLSSIAVNGERVGLEAAALLERILQGGSPPAAPILLPPVGVVVRESTDLLAIRDADIVKALTLIRGQIASGIGVADVARHVAVSRRTLERKFRSVIGRGIGVEIRRQRIDRAKNLLIHTDLTIADVAQQAGFSSLKQLSVAFRRGTSQTPSEFRRKNTV